MSFGLIECRIECRRIDQVVFRQPLLGALGRNRVLDDPAHDVDFIPDDRRRARTGGERHIRPGRPAPCLGIEDLRLAFGVTPDAAEQVAAVGEQLDRFCLK